MNKKPSTFKRSDSRFKFNMARILEKYSQVDQKPVAVLDLDTLEIVPNPDLPITEINLARFEADAEHARQVIMDVESRELGSSAFVSTAMTDGLPKNKLSEAKEFDRWYSRDRKIPMARPVDDIPDEEFYAFQQRKFGYRNPMGMGSSIMKKSKSSCVFPANNNTPALSMNDGTIVLHQADDDTRSMVPIYYRGHRNGSIRRDPVNKCQGNSEIRMTRQTTTVEMRVEKDGTLVPERVISTKNDVHPIANVDPLALPEGMGTVQPDQQDDNEDAGSDYSGFMESLHDDDDIQLDEVVESQSVRSFSLPIPIESTMAPNEDVDMASIVQETQLDSPLDTEYEASIAMDESSIETQEKASFPVAGRLSVIKNDEPILSTPGVSVQLSDQQPGPHSPSSPTPTAAPLECAIVELKDVVKKRWTLSPAEMVKLRRRNSSQEIPAVQPTSIDKTTNFRAWYNPVQIPGPFDGLVRRGRGRPRMKRLSVEEQPVQENDRMREKEKLSETPKASLVNDNLAKVTPSRKSLRLEVKNAAKAARTIDDDPALPYDNNSPSSSLIVQNGEYESTTGDRHMNGDNSNRFISASPMEWAKEAGRLTRSGDVDELVEIKDVDTRVARFERQAMAYAHRRQEIKERGSRMTAKTNTRRSK